MWGSEKSCMALKDKYWEMGDYQAVKKVRIAIKEWDKAHPPKEKVKPYELFDGPAK